MDMQQVSSQQEHEVRAQEQIDELIDAIRHGTQLLISGDQLSLRTPEGKRFILTISFLMVMGEIVQVRTADYCEKIALINRFGLSAKIKIIDTLLGHKAALAFKFPSEPTDITFFLEIKEIEVAF